MRRDFINRRKECRVLTVVSSKIAGRRNGVVERWSGFVDWWIDGLLVEWFFRSAEIVRMPSDSFGPAGMTLAFFGPT